MSYGNLTLTGKNPLTEIHVSSLKYAELTTTERNALAPEEGLTCFDTTLKKLMVYANAAWSQFKTAPASGPNVAVFGPNVATTLPINDSGNVCNYPIAANAVASILSGGMLVSTAGVCIVPSTGFYRVYAQLSVDYSTAPLNGSATLTIRDSTGATQYLKASVAKFAGADTTARQFMLNVYGIVSLTAGQSLTMYVGNTTTTAGATLNIAAIGTGPLNSYMTVEAI